MKEGLQPNHKRILFFLAYAWPLWMLILAYLNGRGEKLKYIQGWRMIMYGHLFYLAGIILLTRIDSGTSDYLLKVLVIFYAVSGSINTLLNLYIIFSRHMSTLTAWLDNYFEIQSAQPAPE